MSKKESLVEDTFIQLKNLEGVIAENAQGILASTMKEEIKELVKESLNEQDDEEEVDLDAEVDTDADNDEMEMDMDMDVEDEDEMDSDEDEMDMDMDMDVDMGMDVSDDDTIDLTNASDEEILRVFKAMNDDDGIIVKKEDNMLHLSDDNEDVEYLIQLGESYEDMEMDEMYDMDEMNEMDELDLDDLAKNESDVIYELELDPENEDGKFSMRGNFFDREDEEDEFGDRSWGTDDFEGYQPDEDGLGDYFEMDEMDDMGMEMDEYVMESAKFKAKGVGMGNASKFKYNKKPNQDGGFDVKKKQGTRGVGMGKAKFEYKEEVNGKKEPKGNTMVKKMETKEASRTLGNGSRNYPMRKGLPKLKVKPRVNESELQSLREKNEEYRKALNLFRTKLNEVAVFNSNLAYATRLFTEHSTTKQEKINILKRFDGVETIKESKNLYRSIKDELSTTTTDNTITESFERTVIKTPTSGSAVNLIESKTYENPQFMRMKDLMGKLK
jgi:hypothetical protein